MANLTAWDGLLLAVGAYVAVMALVRLMSAHRKKIAEELRQQIRAEQLRNKARQASDNSRGEAA